MVQAAMSVTTSSSVLPLRFLDCVQVSHRMDLKFSQHVTCCESICTHIDFRFLTGRHTKLPNKARERHHVGEFVWPHTGSAILGARVSPSLKPTRYRTSTCHPTGSSRQVLLTPKTANWGLGWLSEVRGSSAPMPWPLV